MKYSRILIAGSEYEALGFILRAEPHICRSEWLIVTAAEQLRDYDGPPHGAFVGAWRARPDIEEVMKTLANINFRHSWRSLGLSTVLQEYYGR